MAFYVSVVDGSRRCLALGPFRRHGDAARLVDPLRHWMRGRFANACWWAYGTARHHTSHDAGRLNAEYGLELVDGWAVAT